MAENSGIEWTGARRYGPAPNPPRDGDKEQARQRVNVEVRTGRRPHPNSLPCTDCGHIWAEGERRHENRQKSGISAACPAKRWWTPPLNRKGNFGALQNRKGTQ